MNEDIVNPQPEAVMPTQQPVQPEVVTETPTVVAPKKSNKVLLIILISLFVFFGFIALIFFIVNSATKEPFKASNEFLTAFTTEDAQTVYDSTSTQFQAAVSLEEFESFQDKYMVMGLDKAKVTGKSIQTTNDSTTATLTYSLEYDSENWTIEIEMIQEGEQWKLFNMSIE